MYGIIDSTANLEILVVIIFRSPWQLHVRKLKCTCTIYVGVFGTIKLGTTVGLVRLTRCYGNYS